MKGYAAIDLKTNNGRHDGMASVIVSCALLMHVLAMRLLVHVHLVMTAL